MNRKKLQLQSTAANGAYPATSKYGVENSQATKAGGSKYASLSSGTLPSSLQTQQPPPATSSSTSSSHAQVAAHSTGGGAFGTTSTTTANLMRTLLNSSSKPLSTHASHQHPRNYLIGQMSGGGGVLSGSNTNIFTSVVDQSDQSTFSLVPTIDKSGGHHHNHTHHHHHNPTLSTSTTASGNTGHQRLLSKEKTIG